MAAEGPLLAGLDVRMTAVEARLRAIEDRMAPPAGQRPLSPGQRDLLALLAEELTAEEIAHRRGVRVGTVKSSLTALYERLGVQTRAGAVREGFRRGLLR